MRHAALAATLAFVFLAAGLFAASEDAAGQPYTYPRKEFCPLDVMLVIDESGSMGRGPGSRMAYAKDGAKNFLDELNLTDDQSGLEGFDSTALLYQELQFDHMDTKRDVDRMPRGGGTTMAAAVKEAHDQFLLDGRADARWMMIVLADGAATDQTAAAVRADDAKADGIEIHSIMVQGADAVFMRDVASDPDSQYYHEASTAAEIEDAFDEIINDLPKVCVEVENTAGPCHTDPVVMEFSYLRVREPGELFTVEWDWGDGSNDLYYASGLPDPLEFPHTYAAPGWYTISVEVTDDRGMSDSFTTEVYRSGCPAPAFTCASATHPHWLRVDLNDGSTDPDDNIVDLEWNFGDPDIPGGGTGTGAYVNHVYPAEGYYDVTLTATDLDNNTVSLTKSCFADNNFAPAIIAPDEVVVYEGDRVRFGVSGSDPDGDTVFWTWSRGDVGPSATWNQDTKIFDWTTRTGDAGVYAGPSFSARDPYFAPTSAQTTIRVLETAPGPEPESEDSDNDGIPDAMDDCTDCGEGMDDAGSPPATDPGSGRSEDPTSGVSDPVPDPLTDSDGDGVFDSSDNCVLTWNPAQGDIDGDAAGDLCDADVDGDHMPNTDVAGRLLDNCVYTFNPLQEDLDEDGVGDACQGDVDADGIADGSDNCVWVPNALQQDRDEDGVGDACEEGDAPFGTAPSGGGGAPADDADGVGPTGSTGGIAAGTAWAIGLGAVLLLALVALLVVRRRHDA